MNPEVHSVVNMIIPANICNFDLIGQFILKTNFSHVAETFAKLQP